jgi:hypothetical protein
MTVETVDYNGYRLEVVPVGKGWRASIYPPDSAEAKKIVDARAARQLMG